MLIQDFLRDETGAVTVDWTVLAAAAMGMAIAATAVITDGIEGLSSNLEAQLRTQQISDAFVQFTSTHFDPLYDAGVLDEETAETLFTDANEKTNQEVLDSLEYYIDKINDGTINEVELAEAFAVASVAAQRNIVDDAVIEYYFLPDGGGYEAPVASAT